MVFLRIHLPSFALAAVASTALLWPPELRAHTRPPVTAKAAAGIVDVELLERGGKGGDRRIAFVVPVDGHLESWVRRGDEPRFCRVRAGRSRAGELSVSLWCAGSKSASTGDLEVSLTRRFVSGERVVLGELHGADGSHVEVRATLR